MKKAELEQKKGLRIYPVDYIAGRIRDMGQLNESLVNEEELQKLLLEDKTLAETKSVQCKGSVSQMLQAYYMARPEQERPRP